MKLTTVVMLIGSLGFIALSLIMFFSRTIKNKVKESGIASNVDKYVLANSIFYAVIGGVGIILTVLDYIYTEKSTYIVIVFVFVMLISSIYQSIRAKKYN